MIDQRADLDTVVGDQTVLVDGGEARAFAKDALLAVVRNYDAVRHHGWLEAFVNSYTTTTHSSVWWVAGVAGWDFLLKKKPSEELRAMATSVTEWKPHARLHDPKAKAETEEKKSDG
jgi:hypothetical protein